MKYFHQILCEAILKDYRKLVKSRYPHSVSIWPIINGCEMTSGVFSVGDDAYYIFIFKDTDNHGFKKYIIEEEYDLTEILENELEKIRERVNSAYGLSEKDAVVFMSMMCNKDAEHSSTNELKRVFKKHKKLMGK